MAVNLSTVMDSIGTALGTISGLRVYDYPPKSAQPPFAFVNMPEAIDYDLTMGRGHDRMTVEVWLGIGSQVDRVARDTLSDYAAGSGSSSVKAAIDAASIGSSARVTRAEFSTITLSGNAYPGIVFQVDIEA